MEKIELKVSMEPERLDALRYFLQKQQKGSPQKELERALEELYETYVPADTRAYLDSRCRPAAARPRPKRPARSSQAKSTAAPAANGQGRTESSREKGAPLVAASASVCPAVRGAGLGYPRRIGGPVGRISANFPGFGGVRF